MKINELISEQTDIDEGLGSFLGKAAGHAVGGVGAAWRDAKQGYKDAKAVWDPKDPPGTYNNDPAAPPATGTVPAAPPATGTVPAEPTAGGTPSPAPTGDTGRPYVAPAPAGGAPAPAPAADPGAIGSIMQAVDKLDPASKKQLAGELEKSMAAPPPAAETPPAPGATPPAEPQGSTYDPEKAAADKLAKGQADQQQAQQQMAATQQANAATSQQDASIKAAADAANAKPPFQQTAADKLAIKAAADKGIKEAEEKKKKLKKKKVVTEFKSKFLGMMI